MNDQELKKQIETLEREYKDIRKAISLALNLNNNAILAVTIARPGVAAESILKCIIRRERINVKTNDPKIPIERADEIRKIEVQKVMLDEMIKLVEQRIPLRILTHLRTIQAWRNIGSHDQGENNISETVNSSTLQVVTIALSELVNWFVGEYLNHDISGFNYNEVLNEDKTEISTNEWQEEYWFAMRKGSLKALDEAKLNKIQHIHNLSSEEIEYIKSNFERKEELFFQILNEAFDDNIIDIDELEAIEHSRASFCISSKETKEILEKFNWKSKFKDNPEKLNVDWMRDELVAYRLQLESNLDNTLVTNKKNDNLDISQLSNLELTEGNSITLAQSLNIDNQGDSLTELFNTGSKKFESIFQDEKVEIFTEGDSDYLIKFKPSFLSRLDFCFFIDKNDFFINSVSNNLFIISDRIPDNFLKPNKSDRRDIKTSSGFGNVKINIPNSKNEFLPDWKKNLLSEEQDQDISMLIETFPNEPNKFNLTIKIGRYNKKLRLSFGAYYINEINLEKRNYFQN